MGGDQWQGETGKGADAGRIKEQVIATDTWVQSHWGLTETVGETQLQHIPPEGPGGWGLHHAVPTWHWLRVISALNPPALWSAGGSPQTGSLGTCSMGMALARGCGQGTTNICVVGTQEGHVENDSRDNWLGGDALQKERLWGSHLGAQRGMISSVWTC